MFNNDKVYSDFQANYFKDTITKSLKMFPARIVLDFQIFVQGTEDPNPVYTVDKDIRIATDNIDEFNIARYPYGDVQEGDLAVFIPVDLFPDPPEGHDMGDLTNTEIIIRGHTFTTVTDFIRRAYINDEFMFWATVVSY